MIFVLLNGSSVGLNYWSHAYHCHAGKLIQMMLASYSAILNSVYLALRAGIVWHCITRSLGLVLPFFLPSSVPTSILRFFTWTNIPKENARSSKNWMYHFYQQ